MEDNILTNVETPASHLESLVGEGKKYKDVEELAKAYANADKHIKTMEEDNGTLRNEFESFREFATKQLSAPRKEDQGLEPLSERQPEPKPARAAPEVNEVDLDAKIANALSENDEKRRLKENADLAQEAMVRQFGSKEEAIKAVQKKAEELGVSAQWLANTAFQSPKAFFASMGIDPNTLPKSTSTPANASDVSPSRLADAHPGVKPGTESYYRELRRKDPRLYFSAKIQNEMMENAHKLGPDFYN